MLRSATKHILLIFLTGLLLFNTGGSLVFFKLKEKVIERKVALAIANGQFDKTKLVRVEAAVDEELNINGRWHDVVFTTVENGKKVSYCMPDDEETNWHSFAAYFNNVNEDDDNNDEQILNTFYSYYETPSQAPVYGRIFTIKSQYQALYLILYTQAKNLPPTPPPRQLPC